MRAARIRMTTAIIIFGFFKSGRVGESSSSISFGHCNTYSADFVSDLCPIVLDFVAKTAII
jgi:hypothetical protein